MLTLAWGILISAFGHIIYFVVYQISDFTLGTTVIVITAVLTIGNVFLLKYTRFTDLAGNIITGIVFFNTLITSFFTGGLNSPILIWMLFVPIVCIFVLERPYNILWIFLVIATLVGFFVFFPQGSADSIDLFQNPNTGLFTNLVILLLVIWYSAMMVDNNKNQAIIEANAAKEEAHRIANELELELSHRGLIELALRESEERLDLAIRGADMGTWDWNVMTGEMARNEKYAEILGFERDEINFPLDDMLDLIHPEDRSRVEQAIEEHLAGHSSIFRSEYRVQKKQGEWIWVLSSGAVTTKDADGTSSRMVGITMDITDKKLYEVQLQHLANTDALTGLINRRYFFELAHTEFKRAERYNLPLSIAMIDLDHFKKVNDRYGHRMGDYILFQFAKLFMKQIRDMDILARYGGEEFVILFPHINSQEALDSAERIRKLIEETNFQAAEDKIHLTVSLGIASNVDHKTEDIESLLDLADKALYRSKNGGRNRTTIWDAAEQPLS